MGNENETIARPKSWGDPRAATLTKVQESCNYWPSLVRRFSASDLFPALCLPLVLAPEMLRLIASIISALVSALPAWALGN